MEKLVIEVINEAFFKAQIYGQDYETLDSSELKKGLTNLQYVIAEKNADDAENRALGSARSEAGLTRVFLQRFERAGAIAEGWIV